MVRLFIWTFLIILFSRTRADEVRLNILKALGTRLIMGAHTHTHTLNLYSCNLRNRENMESPGDSRRNSRYKIQVPTWYNCHTENLCPCFSLSFSLSRPSVPRKCSCRAHLFATLKSLLIPPLRRRKKFYSFPRSSYSRHYSVCQSALTTRANKTKRR